MFHYEPGMYAIYKADTGAVRFKVRQPLGEAGLGFAVFALTSKKCPKDDLYKIHFSRNPSCTFVDMTKNKMKTFTVEPFLGSEFREVWLTWHSNIISFGIGEQIEPVFKYTDEKIGSSNIGYIKFYMKCVFESNRNIHEFFLQNIEWLFEASPVILKPLKEKYFEGGQLHWSTLPEDNRVLPKDALVAGFEYEAIYITRAMHNGALCPGKYVPSKQCGYIPCGGVEHRKEVNEILCGFNAKWIKTRGNFIPENAFIAGYADTQKPIYVGRALFDNQLLVGKVYIVYSRCYLPYKGKEIEMHEYEILVTTDVKPRAVFPYPVSA